jgi:hypothetical protein
VLEVATERMFAELTIMKTIASVSKALHEYERAGGFAPHAAPGASETVSVTPATGMEHAADASALPPTSESQEVLLPQLAKAVETAAAVAATDASEVVAGGAGSSPSLPVAAAIDEVRAPDEPSATVQEQNVPEDMTRVASLEIQEVEKAGAAALTGAAGGEVQSLELACTSWAATSGFGNDAEDDEEAAVCNTLERGLNWAHYTFDELILPTTSVSFLV